MSNWLVEYRCASCDYEVSDTQRRYAKCCPHCGELADCTFLRTTQHVYMVVVSRLPVPVAKSWWQFWKPSSEVVRTTKRVYKE